MLADRIGKLHVNWGGMFSGKTEDLVRRIRRAEYANKKVQVFKPYKDDRYGKDEPTITTHVGFSIPAEVVKDSYELYDKLKHDTDLVAIDEIQFFDDEIVHVINAIRRYHGVDVIVSGLDMWSNGDPIALTSKLAAISTTCEKHRAVCVDTGDDAWISHCLIEKDTDILVGGTESYIALSEKAFLERTRK